MHKKLIIIGASGHGKVVADIALKLQKYEEIVFLDDNEDVKECMGFSVVGKSLDAEYYINKADFFVAIGNEKIRKEITEQLERLGANIPTFVHPSAVIGSQVKIGEGTVVMAGAVVNPDCVIGKGCIINTCASVDHDCQLSDYVHVSVGAHVCGTVEIGENTWIGAGATVKNNVLICSNCMIGAGAVVVKNIERKGIYMGIPVKEKNMNTAEKFGGGVVLTCIHNNYSGHSFQFKGEERVA